MLQQTEGEKGSVGESPSLLKNVWLLDVAKEPQQ